MNKKTFALRGIVCTSENNRALSITEDACLVCRDGVCAGIYKELPEKYRDIPCEDFTGKLIIPGLTDLHIHAPQYAFRGFGMDLELLEWLNTIAFPEEARYADPDYARRAYEIFSHDLKKSATTRACIFGTLHLPATGLLMDMLEDTGLITYVGKVNMDRNCPDILREADAEQAAADTLSWIEVTKDKYRNTRPILTPRFTPACSDRLLGLLGDIQRKYALPVQSHLSENPEEVALVQELCPDTAFYGESYDRFGLFGGERCPTIMAHCVHSSDEEISLMKKRGVFIAHCAQSNTNLASGIAPVRRYLDEGMNVGLGTDIAAGSSLSMLRAMADTIQASKLRRRLKDASLKPLSLDEAFYMATAGGGAFFGKVGRFREGYDFDAVILDDRNLPGVRPLASRERLERLIYLSDERNIVGKYVAGKKIF